MEAEVFAQGIRLAQYGGMLSVIIEIDSQHVCNRANSAVVDLSPAGDVTRLIKSLKCPNIECNIC